ncbi:hypothetical protein FRB95_007245 [Tulasnella sp. JGI-2019a]|nr:hypothetical protein FRB95_007245 [Tulasnella sp. JGI-2019a]
MLFHERIILEEIKALAVACRSSTRRGYRNFTVLALESSADDSCAAVVDSRRNVLSNIVEKHPPYGNGNHQLGIHPYVAVERHQRNMPIVIQRALREAAMSMNDIDGIAFTRGPGMAGCLAVAANAGRGIAAALDKPIIGVHHMQAHALTPMLTAKEPPKFPFLTLLLSGGHSLLLVVHSPKKFHTLATTTDCSIGQALDSVARLLGLSWHDENGHLIGPGAALERLARQSSPAGEDLPEVPKFPLACEHHLAFSFAGPKGEVSKYLKSLRPEALNDQGLRIAIAASFQKAVMGQVEEKVRLALKWADRHNVPITSLVASGGVASNLYLRERLEQVLGGYSPQLPLICPPLHMCTDNAAMIGWASMYRFLERDHDALDIDLLPSWALKDLDTPLPIVE